MHIAHQAELLKLHHFRRFLHSSGLSQLDFLLRVGTICFIFTKTTTDGIGRDGGDEDGDDDDDVEKLMLLKLMQKRWSSCDEAGRRRLVRKLMKRAGRTTNWGEWSADDHGDDDDHGDEEDEGGAVVGDADDDGDGCP